MKTHSIFNILKQDNIIILMIMVMGTFLRLYNIDSRSLWLDELYQYTVASRDLPFLLEGVMTSSLSPPLDYIILHLLLKLFSHTEFIVRLPSAIFGVLSIYLTYKIGNQLFSPKVGLVSAFLLSISPFAIYYSQEARMYSSFMFFSLLSIYFLNEFMTKNDFKTYSCWILSSIALIYTHYFGFLVLLIQVISIIYYISNVNILDIRKLIVGFSIIGLSFIPWFYILINQIGGLSGILYYGITGDIRNFFINPFTEFLSMSDSISPIFTISILFILIGVIYFIIMKRTFIWRYHYGMILLIVWIFFPLLILYIMTLAHGSVTTNRNLIFILPAYLLIISLGIVNTGEILKFKNLTIVTIIFVVIISIMILPYIYDSYIFSKQEDWRGVGRYLTENTKDNDNIITLAPSLPYLEFYYHGKGQLMDMPHDIKDMIILINRQSSSKNCLWIFNTGHSNYYWRLDQQNTNRTIIINLLNEHEKINGLYVNGLGREEGVYKICKKTVDQ